MKALTIRQPWAHCLFGTRAGRRRRFEQRDWLPRPYGVTPGERIAIHAAAKQGPATWEAIETVCGPMVFGYDGNGHRRAVIVSSGERVVFGALLGTVRLRAVWMVRPVLGAARARLEHLTGADSGRLVDLQIGPDAGFGDRAWWQTARYAWELDEPERYAEPRPARGRQGLWTVPEDAP